MAIAAGACTVSLSIRPPPAPGLIGEQVDSVMSRPARAGSVMGRAASKPRASSEHLDVLCRLIGVGLRCRAAGASPARFPAQPKPISFEANRYGRRVVS